MARQCRDSSDRSEGVRSGAKVRDLSQVLERVPLWLERVGVGVLDPSDHFDRVRLHLQRLSLASAFDDFTSTANGAAGREFQNLVLVVFEHHWDHDLKGIEAGSIGDLDEGDAGFGIPTGSDPSGDFECVPTERFGSVEKRVTIGVPVGMVWAPG